MAIRIEGSVTSSQSQPPETPLDVDIQAFPFKKNPKAVTYGRVLKPDQTVEINALSTNGFIQGDPETDEPEITQGIAAVVIAVTTAATMAESQTGQFPQVLPELFVGKSAAFDPYFFQKGLKHNNRADEINASDGPISIREAHSIVSGILSTSVFLGGPSYLSMADSRGITIFPEEDETLFGITANADLSEVFAMPLTGQTIDHIRKGTLVLGWASMRPSGEVRIHHPSVFLPDRISPFDLLIQSSEPQDLRLVDVDPQDLHDIRGVFTPQAGSNVGNSPTPAPMSTPQQKPAVSLQQHTTPQDETPHIATGIQVGSLQTTKSDTLLPQISAGFLDSRRSGDVAPEWYADPRDADDIARQTPPALPAVPEPPTTDKKTGKGVRGKIADWIN